MPPAHCKKPPIRRPTSSLAPGPEAAPIIVPNNDFFQEFMRICIKKVRDQALAALAASAAKVRDDIDRLLKPLNPNLYYSYVHMEYYYFYQQYEDYFEVARSLSHKRIPFAIGFLKDFILNR